MALFFAQVGVGFFLGISLICFMLAWVWATSKLGVQINPYSFAPMLIGGMIGGTLALVIAIRFMMPK